MRQVVWLVGLFLVAGCASAPVRPAEIVNLDAADLQRLHGCYDCLLEARDAYQAAAVGRMRPHVIQRLFETEIVIALREKEFALDASATLDRARALVAELPSSLDAARYLYDIEQIPHEGTGWSRSDALAFRQVRREFPAKVDEEIAWIRTGALAPAIGEYVAFSLDCAYRTRPRLTGPPTQIPVVGLSGDVPPLVAFRSATCGRIQLDVLDRVRTEVPGFVETSYFSGAAAVASISTGGPLNPHALVAEVQRRFPDSPAVVMLAARLQQAVGDYEQALGLFARLIAMSPRHEDAWLGRTIAYTELQRPEEAIAEATRIVELGLDNVDQALYWRAWNRHTRAELDLARADIDGARGRRITPEILTLAGVIEHDQDELPAAERDLQRALAVKGPGLNCRAEWYLGSVFVKRKVWRDAAMAFDKAMSCYEADVQIREQRLSETEANATLDAAFKRRQVDRLRGEILSQRHQRFAAAVNAANFHLATGNVERGRALIEIATAAPELSAEVASLREYLAEVRGAP